MPMISYRCPDCGCEDEGFYHHPPASIPCRGVRLNEPTKQMIERRVPNPDGTETIEYEEIELAPTMDICTGTMLQRASYPGELWSRPARGFEQLSIYERADYDALPDAAKRGIERFYVPGRNNETTEAGYRRIDITNMHEYNRWVKRINEHETSRMKDHRSMHEEYWKARRTAMRDNVNARIRSSPLLVSLAREVRKRADQKTINRYGKQLDAKFHSQLLEFNQSNMQDWCDADTGWKSRRAK